MSKSQSVVSIHSSTESELIQINNILKKRLSARLKSIEEQNKRLSSSEQFLLKILKKKHLLKYKDSPNEAILKWTPRIELKKLSNRTIARYSDDWSFLDHVHFTDATSFKFQILAKRQNQDTNIKEIFIRWFPTGLIDDEWLDIAELPKKFSNIMFKTDQGNRNYSFFNSLFM